MGAREPGSRRRHLSWFAGVAAVMLLCCAAGPAVIGPAAAGAVGGRVGIAVGCLVAATVLYLRRARSGS